MRLNEIEIASYVNRINEINEEIAEIDAFIANVPLDYNLHIAMIKDKTRRQIVMNDYKTQLNNNKADYLREQRQIYTDVLCDIEDGSYVIKTDNEL